MAEQSVQTPPAEPKFLTYLLSQDQKHDCYFVVGRRELVQPKRIGVVRKMLMAHSEVFRLELEESELAEKGDVPMEDLYPDTFINLLRYVYGHDTTASLSFEAADNLLYAAEKYIMLPLKARVSTRLMDLLTPDNICQLLNNPACYSTLELQSSITTILQYETDRVLDSPAFLNTSPDAFVKILEQEIMIVEEIELWRAAVKWAKHKGETEEGKALRKQLSKPLKHIRVCTISHEDFFKEVVTTDVLESDEVKLVCLYHGTEEKQDGLVEVSNETEPREMALEEEEEEFTSHVNPQSIQRSSLTIVTKTDVELLPLEFTANPKPRHAEGLTYQCDCTVQIKEIIKNTPTTTPVTVRFNQEVQYGSKFIVPITDNGRNVPLLPNKKYTVDVNFTPHQEMYYSNNNRNNTYENEYISVTISNHPNFGYSISPVKKLVYRARKRRV